MLSPLSRKHSSRKRHHLIKRLRRASSLSGELANLVMGLASRGVAAPELVEFARLETMKVSQLVVNEKVSKNDRFYSVS